DALGRVAVSMAITKENRNEAGKYYADEESFSVDRYFAGGFAPCLSLRAHQAQTMINAPISTAFHTRALTALKPTSQGDTTNQAPRTRLIHSFHGRKATRAAMAKKLVAI